MKLNESEEQRRRYRVIDNPADDKRHPYALLDSEDMIIRIDTHPRHLAAYAFDELGAHEVRHDEDLIKAGDLWV